jgi:hypothetical protein
MQSHGVLSKTNSVPCTAVSRQHCQKTGRRSSVCSVEFPQCKCSVSSTLSSSNSRLLKCSLQSSFVSRTSHLLVPNISETGSRRVKRAAVVSPRAIVATATEVAEVSRICYLVTPLEPMLRQQVLNNIRTEVKHRKDQWKTRSMWRIVM